MDSTQLSKLSDQELLQAAKNSKPKPVFDAFFIGFMAGILIYGAAANALGFFMLIPLFMIYLFLKKPKQQKALQDELKKRNLKT
jgi:hypothetical protein